MKPTRPARLSVRDEKARRHLRAAHGLEVAGDLRGAVEEYHQVTLLQPRNVAVLCKLGLLLRMVGEIPKARKVLERAVKADPRHAESHVNLGMVLKYSREPEKALESYQRAVWADSREIRAYLGIFGIHEQMNRLDDAEEAIQSALAVEPRHQYARVLLARVQRRRGDLDGALSTLRALLAQPIDEETSQRANFELGRCLEKKKDYDGAFEAFARANESQSKSAMARSVDSTKWLKFIEDAHAITEDHCIRWAQEPPFDDGPAPVFLFGFPRSGTTMTEQILGAHPDVAVSDEEDLFTSMYSVLFPTWSDETPLLEQIEAIPRELLIKGRATYRSDVRRLLGRDAGTKILVDKNPMNIVALGLVNRVFPDARVIIAMRDPRDVCLSCFFQEFVPNPSNNFFFTPEGTLDMYQRVMGLWLAQRDILKLKLIESRYETITSDFENQARRLIDFLDLQWDDQILEFHTVRRSHYVSTPSFEAVTSPVHTKAQGKWRNYESHIGPLLEGLAPLIEAFGYER